MGRCRAVAVRKILWYIHINREEVKRGVPCRACPVDGQFTDRVVGLVITPTPCSYVVFNVKTHDGGCNLRLYLHKGTWKIFFLSKLRAVKGGLE
jgi:hypothetical protein